MVSYINFSNFIALNIAIIAVFIPYDFMGIVTYSDHLMYCNQIQTLKGL